MGDNNPLLEDPGGMPFRMPPFSRIQSTHFSGAFEEAMKTHLKELQKIVDDQSSPNFENTMAKLDRSGRLLDSIEQIFANLCSSLNTPEMQDVQSAMVPILSRHRTAVTFLPGLFDKVEAVYKTREGQGLTDVQIRLSERFYLDFVRAGAKFDDAAKKEYADILAQLAELMTQFQQNVMKDEETQFMVLQKEDLTGLPSDLVEAAQQAAKDRKCEGNGYVITLSRSMVEPFLTYSNRRDLREKAFCMFTRRGEMDAARNNQAIAEKILLLRQRQAQLHGYASFAEYQCSDTMAKTPATVMSLLERVWERAKKSAERERKALEEYVAEKCEPLEGGLQPWDWRYVAEKVRQSMYEFEEEELKPYLSLDKVTAAVMAVSNKLYGLKYVHRPDIQGYHPDVRVYEVHEQNEDGKDALRAIFLHDNYARPYKASGAWMSEFRSQTKNLPPGSPSMEAIPIVVNNNNFTKGSPTLLSFEDAITLFHEMGHAHHGMLSDVQFSRLASTNVLTDFVELPSQLMEHFLKEPEVLKEYATHHKTSAVISDDLLTRREAASTFNQGFDTIEYTACALLDMAMHMREDYTDFDLKVFEEQELARLGMPQGIVMRHRPPHFQHLFASSQYAAGYYVYLWAEVLDCDAFAAFKETGNVFDPEVAAKARKYIYSAGNTVAPDELFRQFRGGDPDIKFMMQQKGLE